MGKLRVGLIGCGGISRSHASGYQAVADRAQVVWCCDPNQAAATERAAALGARAVSSYDGLLGDVDAVDICTPHHLHYPAARAALQAGCHVLVEKPLANQPAECDELLALAAAAGKTLMVAYVLRYAPAFERLKEVLTAGTYGELIQIASSVEACVTAEALPWAARRDQLGGGVMFSHGCHTIDLMLDCAGPVRRVAMLGNNVNATWMEGEGTAQLLLEFASGALGHHTSSWALRHTHAIPTLRAWCSDGFLEVAGSKLLAYANRETTVLWDPPAAEQPAMTRQIAHFVDCLASGATPRTNAAAAMASLQVIWAAYESCRSGQMISL
ncbi:MAG: Gfo/Idh/MocA family oxidoreductase [Fimbriimonadaceae bacterium]|nr:Gfo/Idh/MocA family oxidoreductase [Fimbriimonadaceae bacterium]